MEMYWIPVIEKLPEKYREDGELYNYQTVIATLKNEFVCEMWWSGADEKFFKLDGMKKKELTENPVVAWMPMPRPFRVYSLGFWDAEDGKGFREHILTEKDFVDYGVCDYMGVHYIENEMDEYVDESEGE